MDRPVPNKAVIVPIGKRRRRRGKATAAAVEQRAARRRLSPLAALLVGLVGLSVLALVLRAAVLHLAATGGLAAAAGSGMAVLVGLLVLALLAYFKRGEFARRAGPDKGPSRRGPRSGGAFHF